MHGNTITAKISLLTTEKGGRQNSVITDKLHCMFDLNGELFDCRISLLGVGSLHPGQSAELPISFLSPQTVIPKLKIGTQFKLREMRIIGEGMVTSL
jgi:hypothetical protein